ncbi:MAG: hypothetical protein DHS20C18_22270 [Saprospiraceae bacterium]|nr:MAG: hypothetical protein DHS20C18_22270 [Saprospiraceae bacterium]
MNQLRWLAPAVILLVLCLKGPSAICQDPSFSQFYANRVYLNPAFAGLESGVSVTGISRLQWYNADQGFRSVGLTVETQLPIVGLGLALNLLSDTEGIGNLQTNQAGIVLSYTIPGRKNNIHFGMEGRIAQKSINWDALIFSDQIDPIYGVVGSSSLQPVLDKVTYGDFDFGIVWRREGDLGSGKKRLRDVRSQLGISFHHLPSLVSKSAKGNDSFLNRDTRIAPRITIHGGLIIPLHFFKGTGLDIALSPNLKLDMQGHKPLNVKENINVTTFGMYGLINSFYLGLLYQNRFFAPNATHTDAFILTIGGYALSSKRTSSKDPRLFFGLSADINSTGVGPVAGNAFELAFRYRFLPKAGLTVSNSKRKRSRKKQLDCKDFF